MRGDFSRIQRGSERHFDLFRQGVNFFSQSLDRPVILHDARWASKYKQDDQVHDFENIEKIRFENNILEDLTKILIEEIAFDGVIESPTNSIADSAHKWGLANFHYIPEYYQALDEQLFKRFSNFSG